MDCKLLVDRVNLIIRAKNITARQFAESIGVQPSGMSHIMSGRNNPSLEFVMKVVERYPDISLLWLLQGRGELMIGGENCGEKNNSAAIGVASSGLDNLSPLGDDGDYTQQECQPIARHEQSVLAVESEDAPFYRTLQNISSSKMQPIGKEEVNDIDATPIVPPTIAEMSQQEASSLSSTQPKVVSKASEVGDKRKLQKVLLFYSDGTFEEWSQ